jgi:hypothetical protein
MSQRLRIGLFISVVILLLAACQSSAPASAPGTYRSEWMFMVNEGGLRGVGAQDETPLYVQIVVPSLP